ncbi:MAG: ATP-binding cassette domain-containing protein [Clostridia bacterium]|nr:ATP-binding cassette domain-containing protein [Clostridia bacterium]
MDTVLKTYDLTKKYGEKIAVDKLNMTVYRGDIYGFIGKNGAGKTSTMKLILGLTYANGGNIELFGEKSLDKARKKIGSLIEAPGIYKNCTAYENMKRYSILAGGNGKDIKEYLDLVGLTNTGRKKAGAFSLGMKQRLGIAICLLGEPEFLVLDEPINGLDPEGIKDIRDIILRLNKEKGITFLISSHLLDELAKITTRYGIINNGILVEEVTAAELDRRCRSGLVITVNDPAKAVKLIKERAPEIGVNIQGGKVYVDKTEYAASINKYLIRNGLEVSELTVNHGGFEDYFIRRIGN